MSAIGVTGMLLAMIACNPPIETKENKTLSQQLRISVENLKQIGMAIQYYGSAHEDEVPGNIVSKDGKPLLSWRVRILPFLNEKPLYGQFKLDEPWDSEANKSLIDKMPKVYAPDGLQAKIGETFYQTFTGPKTLFNPMPRYKFGTFPDGMSSTAMIVEASAPVVWTQPADLLVDEKELISKLGGLFEGGCHIGLSDGSVMRLKMGADETELRHLINPNDGNVIEYKKLHN